MPSGDSDTHPPTSKPTWLIQARPKSKSHEPWRDMHIEARSALQAEAILRRQGYDVDLRTARVVGGRAGPVSPAAPDQLRCQRCGYELDGITVSNAIVTCPECGFGQVLVTWKSPDDSKQPIGLATLWFLAIIGVFAIGLFGLMMFAAIFF